MGYVPEQHDMMILPQKPLNMEFSVCSVVSVANKHITIIAHQRIERFGVSDMSRELSENLKFLLANR